tara:strand:- start:2525 stop:2683 length:159 start_codon:yes stop_codon:yes gene_type:complete
MPNIDHFYWQGTLAIFQIQCEFPNLTLLIFSYVKGFWAVAPTKKFDLFVGVS